MSAKVTDGLQRTGVVAFCERVEPAAEQVEDLDTARLVVRFQAGERDVFTALYNRYFDRVFGYMRVLLKGGHAAEDATQQVFMQVFEALPRYERRRQPFRAWLFVIVRNRAITELQEARRVEPFEVVEPDGTIEANGNGEGLEVLNWLSDPDLMMLIERLPLPQRQVLLLRYMMDLDFRQIGEILGRRDDDVRALQYRALTFLRKRLAALGRRSTSGGRVRMQRCADKANVLRARRFALLR
ncbi:MAG: polymerase sigma-70 factor, subfamily [Solirubrobacterales bacterium]|nr:polymerase sigma-70 factor, subfamily [Solirubrobacterales bacterium]